MFFSNTFCVRFTRLLSKLYMFVLFMMKIIAFFVFNMKLTDGLSHLNVYKCSFFDLKKKSLIFHSLSASVSIRYRKCQTFAHTKYFSAEIFQLLNMSFICVKLIFF